MTRSAAADHGVTIARSMTYQERSTSTASPSRIGPSSRVADPAVETDLRLVLTAAIVALSDAYRTVVVLRDVEGLSPREIAQITGLSVASVKVRTHRHASSFAGGWRRSCRPRYGSLVTRPRSATS
jgi:RNA polymerase sigma-70 factor (ECF subfamily)